MSGNKLHPLLLGIEGGGTRTVALLVGEDGTLHKRIEVGPANLKLLDDDRLERHLKAIADEMPRPRAVGIGLAGTWCDEDCKRICRIATRIWPAVPCYATNDLETALTAAEPSSAGFSRVLVLSGTGSCCYAQPARGETIKVGSGGHVIADTGSAYRISVDGLRAAFACLEEKGYWPPLGGTLLRALQFNEPDELIGWSATASKAELSCLARPILNAWSNGDRLAGEVIHRAAVDLARQAVVCMKRAGFNPRTTEFVQSGSTLLKQERYRRRVAVELRKLCPGCRVTPLKRESAWGAVELARKLLAQKTDSTASVSSTAKLGPHISGNGKLPPTERRNPRSMGLDKLAIEEGVRLMFSEEAKVPRVLLKHTREIAAAIGIIVKSLKSGGRLIYVGAGTSGRLGVLDASECPPTFRTPPGMVQAIIAGGQRALWDSMEGFEDSRIKGADAILHRGVRGGDVVVGIAASGTTPFVWGALGQARKLGAKTVLVCFNPQLRIPRGERPNVVIAPDMGPEVLTGSTRLKAGTATKLVLNAFTTLTMVRLGKVVSNLMVDLNPSNTKLRARAVRIVREIAGIEAEAAEKALVLAEWDVRAAIQVAGRCKGS